MTQAEAVFAAMDDEPESEQEVHKSFRCSEPTPANVYDGDDHGYWTCSRRDGHRGPHRAFQNHNPHGLVRYEWRS